MNEQQLQKISKILQVRINKSLENEGGVPYNEEEGPSASQIGEGEAEELNDRVEELQDALAQDQGMQADTISRAGSKASYAS